MPVYEVVMASGDWSVKLGDETPITVRDAISVPFGHLVITGTHLPLGRFTGAQVLEAAIYAGVCLRPGPTLEISGKGLPWHLDGGIIETPVSNTDADITTWVGDIMTADDATYPQPFSYFGTSAAGTLSTSFQYVTRRKALDTVVRYYWALEWRIRPTMELVVDSATAIYGAAPTAIIAARADGYESSTGLWGLDGAAQTAVDFESYATRVLAVGSDQIGGASISTPYYGPLGDPLGVGKLIDAPLAAEASAVTTAANILTPLTQPAYDYRLSADRYVISGRATVGSQVWVYDPLNGFVDPSSPITFAGRTVYPRAVRLIGMRWSLQSGMGVYYRHHAIGTGVETWTDLTPYVEWENTPAQLEVGTRLRDLDGNDPSHASLSRPTVQTDAWTPYAPTVDGLDFDSAGGWALGRYRREGATLYVSAQILCGPAAVGSGAVQIGLPNGMVGMSQYSQYISGSLWDVSTGNRWRLTGEIPAGEGYVAPHYADGATTTYLAEGAPISFADGDIIEITGVLEVDINVEEAVAPVVAAFTTQAWATGAVITTIVPTLTAGTLPIVWSATGLPAGIGIDPASGAITGTPTGVGSGTATITATNGAGSDSETISWSTGYAPVIAHDYTSGSFRYINGRRYATGGQIDPYTATLTQGTAPVTWSASNLTPGISINSSTGVIGGTDSSSSGTANGVSVTATNAFGSDTVFSNYSAMKLSFPCDPLDQFVTGPLDTAKWDGTIVASSNISVTGGKLRFTMDSSIGTARVTRGTLQNMRGKALSMRMDLSAAPQVSAAEAGLSMVDGSSFITFGWVGSDLVGYVKPPGGSTITTTATLAYDPTIVFFRAWVIADGTKVIFSYGSYEWLSGGSSAMTQFEQINIAATPWPNTSTTDVRLYAFRSSSPTTYTVDFDDVGYPQ